MNNSFFNEKKILITGHTGFKGGWLTLWLNNLGSKVVGYSLPLSNKNFFFNSANINNHCKSYFGDICDYDNLYKVINDERPEIIIHMAAQALVIDSYEDPLATYKTNVNGTINLLNIIRSFKSIKVFLNVTSDKCYLNKNQKDDFVEHDALGGDDPYSSSKACSEIITNAFRNSFYKKDSNTEVSIATARAGNVIGGGDWASNRLIPDLVRAYMNKAYVEIRNPKATRPWQYVLDPLFGYIKLVEKMYFDKDSFSDAWNFGPKLTNQQYSVEEIIKEMISQWDDFKDVKIKYSKSSHYEAKYLSLNSNKSLEKLGWEQNLNLSNSILFTSNWYKAFIEGEDMNIFSLNQIVKYHQMKGID